MKFIKLIFSAYTVSTLLATAVSGGIIHAITDWNFWQSALSGYLITEFLSMANKVDGLKTDLLIVSQRAFDMEMQLSRIEDLAGDTRNQILDHRVIDHMSQ